RAVGFAGARRRGRPQEAARRDRGHVTQDGREDVHAAPRREVSAERRELDRGRAGVHGEEQGVGDRRAEGVREDDGGVAEAEVGSLSSVQRYPRGTSTAAHNEPYGATFGSVFGSPVFRQVGWPKPLGLM